MPIKIMCTLFNLGRDYVRRLALSSARTCLSENLVQSYLGFQHITREKKFHHIHQHWYNHYLDKAWTHQYWLQMEPVSIYKKVPNSNSNETVRDMHKHRPLVKQMVFVSSTGYIISVISLYFGDGKNNDDQSLNHIIRNDTEEFKQWRSEEDIIIEDRGFRDSLELIQELGIQAEMPSSVKKGNLNYQRKKATPQEWSPKKIRCFVELVNGRLKLWIYIDRILPNSQISYIADYVKIACAFMN